MNDTDPGPLWPFPRPGSTAPASPADPPPLTDRPTRPDLSDVEDAPW